MGWLVWWWVGGLLTVHTVRRPTSNGVYGVHTIFHALVIFIHTACNVDYFLVHYSLLPSTLSYSKAKAKVLAIASKALLHSLPLWCPSPSLQLIHWWGPVTKARPEPFNIGPAQEASSCLTALKICLLYVHKVPNISSSAGPKLSLQWRLSWSLYKTGSLLSSRDTPCSLTIFLTTIFHLPTYWSLVCVCFTTRTLPHQTGRQETLCLFGLLLYPQGFYRGAIANMAAGIYWMRSFWRLVLHFPTSQWAWKGGLKSVVTPNNLAPESHY